MAAKRRSMVRGRLVAGKVGWEIKLLGVLEKKIVKCFGCIEEGRVGDFFLSCRGRLCS